MLSMIEIVAEWQVHAPFEPPSDSAVWGELVAAGASPHLLIGPRSPRAWGALGAVLRSEDGIGFLPELSRLTEQQARAMRNAFDLHFVLWFAVSSEKAKALAALWAQFPAIRRDDVSLIADLGADGVALLKLVEAAPSDRLYLSFGGERQLVYWLGSRAAVDVVIAQSPTGTFTASQ